MLSRVIYTVQLNKQRNMLMCSSMLKWLLENSNKMEKAGTRNKKKLEFDVDF